MTIPTTTRETTATRFGAHFTQDFRTCPFLWWLRHRAKGTGLVPELTPVPLLLGSAYHAGLEAYYLSGWEDGQYDLTAARQAAHLHLEGRWDESKDEQQAMEILQQCEGLLDSYDAEYGPKGEHPEWPNVRVLPDADGHPLVEREFEIDLGYRGCLFTARVDTVVEFHGYVASLEHKTSSVRTYGPTKASWGTDLQMTGQYLCLRSAFPDRPIGGVVPNVILKDWKPKSTFKSPFPAREPETRTDLQLYKFRTDLVRTLQEMDAREAEWQELVDAGMNELEAALEVYTQHTQQCVGGYGRRCDYLSQICSMPGREALDEFRPNPKGPTPCDEESPTSQTSKSADGGTASARPSTPSPDTVTDARLSSGMEASDH